MVRIAVTRVNVSGRLSFIQGLQHIQIRNIKGRRLINRRRAGTCDRRARMTHAGGVLMSHVDGLPVRMQWWAAEPASSMLCQTD